MVVICVRIVDGGADLSRPRVSADWPGFVGNFLAEILGALARDCITLSSPNLRVIHLALSCVVGRVSRRVQSPQGSASALTRHEIPNIPKKKKYAHHPTLHLSDPQKRRQTMPFFRCQTINTPPSTRDSVLRWRLPANSPFVPAHTPRPLRAPAIHGSFVHPHRKRPSRSGALTPPFHPAAIPRTQSTQYSGQAGR